MKRIAAGELFFVAVVLVAVVVELSRAKIYTRCGLAEELQVRKFPRSYIGNWICLIESESSKDTSKVTNKANGSKGLGLFQINSKEWCTFKKSGGKCYMKCEDLTNEDLSDDVACAKKVYEELGFRGWDGWVRSCYKRILPTPLC